MFEYNMTIGCSDLLDIQFLLMLSFPIYNFYRKQLTSRILPRLSFVFILFKDLVQFSESHDNYTTLTHILQNKKQMISYHISYLLLFFIT